LVGKKLTSVYQAIPKHANIPGSNVFTNAYQRSVEVQGDGSSTCTFSIINEWFAIYGIEMRSGDGRVRVNTSNSKPVSLGPRGTFLTLTAPDGAFPRWDDSVTSTCRQTSAAGAFTIATDGTFTNFNACTWDLR